MIKKLKKMIHKTRVSQYALLALILCPGGAFAADLLSGAYTTTIQPTIGRGSSIWFVVYTIEVLAAAWAFIIKKSLPVFLGIVAMIIFTTVAFALIGTPTPPAG